MDKPLKPNIDESLIFFQQNHPSDWFEQVYTRAQGDGKAIPWAGLNPSPDLVEWLDQGQLTGHNQRTLVVGCGLGDDAEELARRGFQVTAFDYSTTAIEWCRRRFPGSSVTYQVADLFNSPPEWQAAFDFVLEYFTIQALPPYLHEKIIKAIAHYVAPGGTLLVICLGSDSPKGGGPPWPLTKETLSSFQQFGLTELTFEEYGHLPDSPVRRFRVQYKATEEPS